LKRLTSLQAGINMKKLHLEIVSPEGIIFKDDIWHCQAPGIAGEFGLLYNHIPFFTVLNLGIVEIDKDEAGKEKEFFTVSGGFLEIAENRITILGETIENGRYIDVTRARHAEEHMMTQLESSQTEEEKKEYRYTLAKARNRIKAYNLARDTHIKR
jgi:F-type H+-transporting ATPase subunit epsilon